MIPRSVYALRRLCSGVLRHHAVARLGGVDQAAVTWTLAGIAVVLLLLTALAVFQPRFAPAPVVVPGTMPKLDHGRTRCAAADAAAQPADAPRRRRRDSPRCQRRHRSHARAARTGFAANLAMTAPVSEPTELDQMTLGRAMDDADYTEERDARRRIVSPERGSTRSSARTPAIGARPIPRCLRRQRHRVQPARRDPRLSLAPRWCDGRPHHRPRIPARHQLDDRLDEPERHDGERAAARRAVTSTAPE